MTVFAKLGPQVELAGLRSEAHRGEVWDAIFRIAAAAVTAPVYQNQRKNTEAARRTSQK